MSDHDGFVFVTQTVDPDDPVLGVICDSMQALARRTRLTVIANRVVRVPEELAERATVVSLGKEREASRARRGLAYQQALWQAIHHDRARALLAHMCPTYLVQAAPVAKTHRVTAMLWFAHWRDSALLATAQRCSDLVLTSLPGAYPRVTPKLHAIGQAIALDRLQAVAPVVRTPNEPLHIAAIGRTSTIKRFDVIVDAAAALHRRGHDVRLRIVGPSTNDAERGCRRALEAQVARLGIDELVSLEGPRPPRELDEVLAWAHVLVNATATGSGDKTVFEAMAARRPVLVSNPAFGSLTADLPLDLTFPEGSVDHLVDRLVALAGAPQATWRACAELLHQRVEAEHSVDHWADAVCALGLGTPAPGARGA